MRTMTPIDPHSTDAETVERLAHDAVTQIPQTFRDHLGDVVFRVQDFADSGMLTSVGLDNRWALLGLYHGRPMGEQSTWSTAQMPSMISLFRLPMLSECLARGVSLEDMVTHVIVHEVGHHFGLSDDDMHAIEEES